jgi:hypothetical protein
MASTTAAPFLTSRSQLLFAALSSVLVVAIISAFTDVVLTAVAIQSSGAQYGFQVMGSFLASIPQVAVELAIIAALATLGGQRLAVRAVAIAAFALGTLVIVLVPFFALDFLQSRRLVLQSGLKGFTVAGEKTGAFAAWFAVMLLWLGWRAFQASRGVEETEKGMKGRGLVVGQE